MQHYVNKSKKMQVLTGFFLKWNFLRAKQNNMQKKINVFVCGYKHLLKFFFEFFKFMCFFRPILTKKN